MKESLFYFKLLGKRLGIALLMFTLCRILFYLFNTELFPNSSPLHFFAGVRFDLSAIAWIFMPFIFTQLLPLTLRAHKLYQKISKLLFHIANSICLIFNIIDIEFYSFTLKRTTADIVSLIGTGDDFITLIPQFIQDYWFALLLFFILIFASIWLYEKTEKKNIAQPLKPGPQLILFAIGVGITIIASRGGLQLRPLSIINASQYASIQNIPLVLNTPFTFIRSLSKSSLKPANYFPQSEIKNIFEPNRKFFSNQPFKQKNVVVIILESFSKEYVGFYNGNKGYTPFLDSLIQKSLYFTNAFANGKRSIEALPAIFSGIPNLMNSPYVSSPYAGNRISSIASVLKSKDYHTSFFHGGSNGTMGFDAFSSAASIEHYYGKDQYPNPKDYDGNWGIFDEPFFQYFADELNSFPQPFFSSIFSLSSHHPYTIPTEHNGAFSQGSLDIHESIGYTDFALKRFFEKCAKMSWYKNTLFVITADHTAQMESELYNNTVGQYAIPLIFFDPQKAESLVIQKTTQQADIVPITLELLDYHQNYSWFGNNPLKDSNSFAINFNNGMYQLISGEYVLYFNGEQTVSFFDFKKDPLLKKNLVNDKYREQENMEKLIKSIIQVYNCKMINNQLDI